MHFYLYDTSKATTNYVIGFWLKTVKKIVASDWSMEKQWRCFLFSSLFFHRPIRGRVALLLFIDFWCKKAVSKNNEKCHIIYMSISFVYKPLGIYSLPFIEDNSYLCKHVKTLCNREKELCACAFSVVPQPTTSLRRAATADNSLYFGSSCIWTMKSVIGVSLLFFFSTFFSKLAFE
jgi:hypothetical protein